MHVFARVEHIIIIKHARRLLEGAPLAAASIAGIVGQQLPPPLHQGSCMDGGRSAAGAHFITDAASVAASLMLLQV